MLVSDPGIINSVKIIVRRAVTDHALHEDFIQIAIIHLWLVELKRPGQPTRWYLRSCRYHVLDELREGKSIDSPKRRKFQVLPPELDDPDGSEASSDDLLVCNDSVVDTVCAREILALLSALMTPLQQRILDALDKGCGVEDIAGQLHISRHKVNREREKTLWKLWGRTYTLNMLDIIPPSKCILSHEVGDARQ